MDKPGDTNVAPEPQPSPLEQDFSIVIGGPLFQALRRAHLSGDALQLVRRRIVTISLLLWLPLLLLSVLDGKAWGDAVKVPFLRDIDAHVRFLLALPLLIVAEIVVHQRMRAIVAQFITLKLVRDDVRARFDAAIASAMRLRNSVAAELLLIAFVYGIGIMVLWRQSFALSAPTWYATPEGGRLHPHLAGWWYLLVSLPLFQFMLLRWYFRIFIWARFLLQVSRLDIAYSPMHPDRNGGIGFLAGVGRAFAPLVLAQGTLLAGMIANRIFFEGAVLTSFKIEIFTFVLIVVGVVIAPFLVFVPALARAKREGERAYRHLAKHYVDGFEAKWFRGERDEGEALVGSGDVQSLADMANSYAVVHEMRMLPVTRDMLVQLVVVALLPLTPLLLTMISVEQLIGKLVSVVF